MQRLPLSLFLLLIFGFCIFFKSLYASSPPVIPGNFQTYSPYLYGKQQLVSELDDIVNAKGEQVEIAVFVKSMRQGDQLYARNINQALAPASTLKILTAEAALIYLGPEYRFSTQLLTDATEIKHGILQGNLYILLNGDPSLTYYDLVELFLELRNRKIIGISGNLYIDNTAYDASYYGPGWDLKDKVYCYAAPISASIINHNCITFQVMPSKVAGKMAQVVTSPKYFYPQIKNTVMTKGKRQQSCAVRLLSGSHVIAIDGCMPKGQSNWGFAYALSNVTDYNRALFKNIMTRLAIGFGGSVSFGRTPDNATLINQHASEPLHALIHYMLKKSDNVIAGALFKKIGQLYTHKPGSWANGGEAVTKILNKYAGVFTSKLHVLDGSGLSPDNLATPAQLMQVLNFAYHHYATSYEFIMSLPIAGVDGTLKNRMTGISGKVRAKTGTISGVVSLAGYAVTADKEPLAFVIMINGNKTGSAWEYRQIEDRIVTALTRYKRN